MPSYGDPMYQWPNNISIGRQPSAPGVCPETCNHKYKLVNTEIAMDESDESTHTSYVRYIFFCEKCLDKQVRK